FVESTKTTASVKSTHGRHSKITYHPLSPSADVDTLPFDWVTGLGPPDSETSNVGPTEAAASHRVLVVDGCQLCSDLHVYTRLQERDELFVLLALGRGEGMVAIWVLLACTWACNPGFVNGDTDGNDGEWVRIPGEPFEVAGLEQIFIKADVNTFLISHAPFAASALYVLFSSLNSASQLTGWKQSGGDPCGESWLGIKCSGSSVTAM
ncbi:hypothetical protein BHE74_00000921, partial [Ensete ventricosum]